MRAEHEPAARAEFEGFLRARGMVRVSADLRESLWEAFSWAWRPDPPTQLRIVFDGPPSHQMGRFVEVEDAEGKSVRAGRWQERGDGYWVLQLGGL